MKRTGIAWVLIPVPAYLRRIADPADVRLSRGTTR